MSRSIRKTGISVGENSGIWIERLFRGAGDRGTVTRSVEQSWSGRKNRPTREKHFAAWESKLSVEPAFSPVETSEFGSENEAKRPGLPTVYPGGSTGIFGDTG